jgi:hypothetical protein
MNKEFIPYEQALALKELGFDEECFAYYYNKELSFGARVAYGEVIESPLKQQVFRWFREVTQWDFAVIKEFNDKEYPYYFYILFADTAGLNKHCKSYEEAELFLIDELIKEQWDGKQQLT